MTVGSAAYVLGGYDGAQLPSDVLRSSDGRHFTSVGNLPVAVRYPAVAVVGTTIYLLGGELAGARTPMPSRRSKPRPGERASRAICPVHCPMPPPSRSAPA